jgi:ABC-type lipoprotein release transport system permease subunit
MVIAMALMTGYREDLQGKLVRGNAAVIAYPVGPDASFDAERQRKLEAIPGVERIGVVAYGQGALSSGESPHGIEVILRGVDPGGAQLAADARQLATVDGIPGTVLGEDLAERLKARPGDVLRLVALGFQDGRPRFRYQSLKVTGTFSTGFAEFDRSWVLLDRARVEQLMGGAAHRRGGHAAPRAGFRDHRLAAAQPRAVHRPQAAADRALPGAGADRPGLDLQRGVDPGGPGARADARHR